MRRRFSSWAPNRVSSPSLASTSAPSARARSGEPSSGMSARAPLPLGVVVEAAPALAAEATRLDHLLEQRRRREALVPVLLEHDVGDVVGCVEANDGETGEWFSRVDAVGS